MAKAKNKNSQKVTKSYKNNQPTSSTKVSAKSSKAKASSKSVTSSSVSSSAQAKSNQSSNNAQNKNSEASTPANKANNSDSDDLLQITEHSPQQQKGIMLTQVWSGAITIVAGLVIVGLASFGVLSATFNLDLMGAIGLVGMYLVLQVIVGLITAKMYNLKLNDVLFKLHI